MKIPDFSQNVAFFLNLVFWSENIDFTENMQIMEMYMSTLISFGLQADFQLVVISLFS